MNESIPVRGANERAARVYERLEPRPDGTADRAYLLLEELVNELASEAMHEIGAETAGGDLDPAAQELFGDTTRTLRQIAQELAEHVYGSTRQYLEARGLESPNVVHLALRRDRSASKAGLS